MASARRVVARLLAAEGETSAGLSLDARARLVHDAMWERGRSALNDADRWHPVEVFDQHVIARRGGKTYRVPWSVGEGGAVEFGDPEEVALQYVSVVDVVVASQAMQMQASAAAGTEVAERGLVWDVVVAEEGPTRAMAVVTEGKRTRALPAFFTAEFLRGMVPLQEGAPVYAMDDSATGHKADESEKLEGQRIGWTAKARYVAAADGRKAHVAAELHLLPEGLAREKRINLVSAWDRGNRNVYQLSIDARCQGGEVRKHDGREYYFPGPATELLSTDFVRRAGAGGRFDRLVASATGPEGDEDTNTNRGVKPMSTRVKKLLAAIQARRPDAVRALDAEAVTWDELMEVAEDVEIQAAFAPAAPPPAAPPAPPQDATAIQAARMREYRAMERIVEQSQLPEKTRDRLMRDAVDVPGATSASVQAAVDTAREELASAFPLRANGLGGATRDAVRLPGTGAGPNGRVGMESIDMLQAGLDLKLGVAEPCDYAGKPLSQSDRLGMRPIGIRAAYDLVSQGQDPDCRGGIMQASAYATVQAAGFDNTTLPQTLANSQSRKVAQEYRAKDHREDLLISSVDEPTDFKNIEVIRWGGFGDLGLVTGQNPSSYPVLAPYPEEMAAYRVNTRGVILSISWEHIRNDDMNHLRDVNTKLGRAARRTHARFIFQMVIDNPVIPLGSAAWFSLAHNNLVTTPASAAALRAIRSLLFNQVEAGSNELLELPMFTAVVPEPLRELFEIINTSEYDPDVPGSNKRNILKSTFGANNERILVNSFMTQNDPNDYAIFTDPNEGGIIRMAYLDGKREPEVIVQDMPTAGTVFDGDEYRWKTRHVYGGTVENWRTGVKAVVAA